MNNSEKTQIDFTFDALRSEVMRDKGKRLQDKSFLGVLESTELGVGVCDDPYLAKLSVISRHWEWESYYKAKVQGSNLVLGVLAYETNENLMHLLPYSHTEQQLLRDAIVKGDEKYNKLLNDLATAESELAEKEIPDSHLFMLNPLRELGRIKEYLYHLGRIRVEIESDPFIEISWPVFFAEALPFETEEVPDLEDFKDALTQFENTCELNDMVGMIDPCKYRMEWVHSLQGYINKKESTESPRGQSSGVTASPEARKLIKTEEANSKTSLFGVSAEFKKSLSCEDMDILKLHDKLCLEILLEHDCPAEAWERYTPCFRGNRIRAWRRLMNLQFPEKQEFLSVINDSRKLNQAMRSKPKWRKSFENRMRLELGDQDDGENNNSDF